MSRLVDWTGLAAGLESAGIAWRELAEDERAEYAVDGVQPTAICWPASYEEAARALAVADRLGLAVSPRGAGTKTALGNPPRACDLIISTERLDQVVEYAPANLTATVQAGLRLAAFQNVLAAGGQYLPLDPPHADQVTIGGIIAANASGPRRFGLGSARDLVIGTRAATTRGTVVRAGGRVVKNVAGYDLNKLYIGSLGTLVLIVEVSFKVAPRPAAQRTVVGSFPRIEALTQAVQTVIRSPLFPVAVDLVNGPALRGYDGPPVPEPGSGFLLATLGTAPGRAVLRQRDDLVRIYQQAGATEITDLADADSERFWGWIAERPARQTGPRAVLAKIAVPIARGGEIVRVIEGRRDAFGGQPAIGGRAGSGVIYLNWEIPESDGGDEPLATTARAIEALRETGRSLEGSLVVEECPRALKDRLDVWGPVGPSFALMRRLKEAMDPRAILNPGRFVGGI